MGSRHWLYLGGFAVTSILLVGAGLVGILEGLSTLSGGAPAGGKSALLRALGAAAGWLVAALVLGLLAALFLCAAVVSLLRNASLPRDDRLVSAVERLERKYPLVREFDVAERFEPTVEDRRRELREQYVAGELGDREFERQLAQLLDETPDEQTTGSDDRSAIEIEDRSR